MTNFIFKSSRRLIKNSPITFDNVQDKLLSIQSELRHARQDNVDIKLMLNKLLIDKHLQMQVDNYFKEEDGVFHETSPQTDTDDSIQ